MLSGIHDASFVTDVETITYVGIDIRGTTARKVVEVVVAHFQPSPQTGADVRFKRVALNRTQEGAIYGAVISLQGPVPAPIARAIGQEFCDDLQQVVNQVLLREELDRAVAPKD